MGSPVWAQKHIEKHLSFSGKEKLMLNIRFADSIVVHTWNKPEVFASALVNINDNVDNEAYLTDFDDVGQVVKISSDFKEDYFKGVKNCCIESVITGICMFGKHGVLIETIDGNITIREKQQPFRPKRSADSSNTTLTP
jgi:hypothetical protein